MIFSNISLLPLEIQREIFYWDPTFHLLYKRLWTHDIIIDTIEYEGLNSSCIWYSNGIHRKWNYSNFISDNSSLFDDEESSRRFWVLQADSDLSFHPDVTDEKIKWTSLHFFNTLKARNKFIKKFGKSKHRTSATYPQLVKFYMDRFCSPV